MSSGIHTIFIEEDGKRYPIFNVGYTADGGFFITDFAGKGNHVIAKVRLPAECQKKVGTFEAPFYEKWRTEFRPKLTHHVDGNVHVSGHGITSGFFPVSRKGKGVSTKSFDLTSCNHDGGPQMAFTVWGLDQFVQPSLKDGICFTNSERFDNPFNPPKSNVAFAIEGFYFPKADYAQFLEQGCCGFRYRGIGIVPMLFVPVPEHSPGLLGFVCHRFDRDSERLKYGVMFGGGASLIPGDQVEMLFIMYPAKEIIGELQLSKARSLDFNGWFKIRVLIRDKIERWFGFLWSK